SFTIKQYYMNVNMNEIKEQVSKISEDISKNNEAVKNILDENLMKSSIIHCYDTNKKLIYSNYNTNNYSKKEINSALEPYIDAVLKGNSINGVTKLYGIDEDVILIGQSIKNNNDIVGTVFFIKMEPEFTSSLNGFYIVLGVSMVLILLSIIIPLYIFIKRILRPLEDMTSATIKMSQGEYNTKIINTRNDEIGELINSFNVLSNKLAENEKQAKLLEQTRRDYIANISHELKTPVASIRAIGEVLNDDIIKNNIDQKKYYNMILRESVRLELLIEDMLELSRLQSGNIAIEKSVVNIDDILKDVVEEFEIKADDLDIKFITPKNIKNTTVYTNKNRIIQVLIILLDNAFKFTPIEGCVSINILEVEDFIKISVCDTGLGIDKDDIPFVFDRFYKADKSHSSIGTGIGLSIASEIMKLLDEEIYVESKVNEGSKFTFTIHKIRE
ncbi:ATP-binding protein, partial [Clostridium sp.]|uniref:sensor histidine kinase n=1 Tax=Clostridium sp. TaxID=1506 RepID=UPI003F31C450